MEKIFVNAHSSIFIIDKKTYCFDPFHIKEDIKADYIFITHGHYDHYSPEDIQKIIKEESELFLPLSMKDRDFPFAQTKHFLDINETYTCADFKLETVASYNIHKNYHPKSDHNLGYILTLQKRFYVCGDSDCTPEAQKVRCDVLLCPVGGTYTMNVEEAVELAKIIRPSLAIPTHYGDIVGDSDCGMKFANALQGIIDTQRFL